ncbi:hypothetical protein Ga0080574_TMP4596 [Salipiger abyssi]|uniref:Uncharacterized protein n=1 Tax=Salipiger abyssi TaxID=1250539 RepID=A0A1P8UZV0_9RHOB|nr:hypothetical protein Ga0080574_TMP4596 [Salipiger abyssi]
MRFSERFIPALSRKNAARLRSSGYFPLIALSLRCRNTKIRAVRRSGIAHVNSGGHLWIAVLF